MDTADQPVKAHVETETRSGKETSGKIIKNNDFSNRTV